MSSLKTHYSGIQLKNPLIAASSGITFDLEHCKRAEDAGFAAVVLKSVQEELIMRYNPNPRFEVVQDGIPGYSSSIFYSYEQAYEYDIDEYCKEIQRCKDGLEIPVIASTNCVTLEKWGEYAKQCEEAGADAIEIVTSCPSGLLMRSAKNIGAIAVEALEETKKAVSIPVGVKMTMQLSSPIQAALDLQEAGADSLIMYNRFTGCEIDIDTMAPILHRGFAGHGGPGIKLLNMRWMIATWPHLNIPVSATGGVVRWEDVIKYMLCGASNAQICALVYLKGYGWVQDMLYNLEGYLDKHGIENITDIIGKATGNFIDNFSADRSKRYHAIADKQKCKQCGKCKDVCIYNALSLKGDGPEIDDSLCDGCNLCVSLCKFGALTMHVK
jgi:dihydroorotate dehydrogenase (fumarate)